MVLLAACGVANAAETVPPARGYPHSPALEPIFVSSKKPLPLPPATISKPVSVPLVQAQAPTPLPNVAPLPNIVAPAQEPQERAVADPPSVLDGLQDYQILLEPPSPERLFGSLDSERRLEIRMRQQALQRNPPGTVQFPINPPLTKEKYRDRNFAGQQIFEEPNFVVYSRLYFEDKNAERYGWDLGFIQPIVSTLIFYKDVTLLPLRFVSHPCQRYDSNAGQCLPGDPVPYIIYPPDVNVFSCWTH